MSEIFLWQPLCRGLKLPAVLADGINELWNRRPFQPFDIIMADGSVFTVISPKLILMTPSQRTLHLVTPEGRSHWWLSVK